MAGTTNTGVVGYISNPVASFPANSITVDIFGNTFYRNYAFGAGDDTGVYWNTQVEYSELQMLFLASMIEQSLRGKYSYGHKLRSSQSFDFKIPLPETADGEIDFEFMESFIRELEEERIRELAAYLTVSGLADATLTANERYALNCFDKLEWQEFRIGDLYDKVELNNKKFDKRSDTRNEPSEDFPLPVVNAKHGDNGIMFWGRNDIFDSEEMTIDIVQNGAVATGDVYPQPQRTGVLWDAYLIKATNYLDTRQTLFFIAASIQKSIKLKFAYEFKATWDRVKNENIYLPVRDGVPDYEVMQEFISAVQKLVIKDVVKYADEKIEAAKNMISIQRGDDVFLEK